MPQSPYNAATLRHILNWIDSVPQQLPLPTMPGFERDWVESLISGQMDGWEPLTFKQAIDMALEWVDSVPEEFLPQLPPFIRPALADPNPVTAHTGPNGKNVPAGPGLYHTVITASQFIPYCTALGGLDRQAIVGSLVVGNFHNAEDAHAARAEAKRQLDNLYGPEDAVLKEFQSMIFRTSPGSAVFDISVMEGQMLVQPWPYVRPDGQVSRPTLPVSESYGGHPAKIVVKVEGGTVTQVLTDHPLTEIVVLDSDVNGCDEDSVAVIDDELYALDALQQVQLKVSPMVVAATYAAVEKNLAARAVEVAARPPSFEM